MLQTTIRRIGSALVALVVLLHIADLDAQHRCPVHSPGIAAPAAPSHVHHHSTVSGGAESTPHDASHHHCTCAGDCCATAPMAFAGHAVVVVATTVVHITPPLYYATVFVPVASPHVLPFANGPPVSA